MVLGSLEVGGGVVGKVKEAEVGGGEKSSKARTCP